MPDRLDVRFPSGDGTCAAWLYLPASGPGPIAPGPVVVMGHGLGALREMRLDAFAERFLAAGYACLVFDYRHFGDSDGEPRQLVSVARQQHDWDAAIAYARSRPELDPERVILWGSSFGGGHVLVAGARDRRVAAVISQCPFSDGLASARAMGLAAILRLAPRAIADTLASLLGRQPLTIAIVGRPGSTALMTKPDSMAGYLALVPDGIGWRNAVPARIALRSLWYRPGRAASRVTAPVLFCVCENDSVAPASATLRHARGASRGEIAAYPIGHFDIYVDGGFERAIADQLEFLARHVPV